MTAGDGHLLTVGRSYGVCLPLLARPTFQRHQPMPEVLDMADRSMEDGRLEEVPAGTCVCNDSLHA
jgi:hypothetical protein